MATELDEILEIIEGVRTIGITSHYGRRLFKWAEKHRKVAEQTFQPHCSLCNQPLLANEVQVAKGHGLAHLACPVIEPKQADEVAFQGCCISAPHRGKCVEPQADAERQNGKCRLCEKYLNKYLGCDDCGYICGKCHRPIDNPSAIGTLHYKLGWIHSACQDFGEDEDKPDTSLSLLIIDLGDSCVVKVEKGSCKGITVLTDMGLLNAGDVRVTGKGKPFAAVREAIDGEKPVPRIERTGNTYRFYPYRSHFDTASFLWTNTDFDQLCEIAGHPLPIYEGGTWEQLFTTASYSFKVTRYKQGDEPELPVSTPKPPAFTVWRYTR